MKWKIILLFFLAVVIFLFLQKRSSSSQVVPSATPTSATPTSTTPLTTPKQIIVKPVSGGNTFEVVVDQDPSIQGAIYYAVASLQEKDLVGNTLTPVHDSYEYVFSAAYSVGKPIKTFPKNAKINMSYTNFDTQFLDVQSLKIYEWKESAKVWQPLKSTIDTQTNKISATISSPGIFSLRGNPKLAKPFIANISPVKISKSNQNIEITITGKNFTPELQDVSLIKGAGSWAALNYHVISSDEMKATFPASMSDFAQSYNLTIRTIDGQETQLKEALEVN